MMVTIRRAPTPKGLARCIVDTWLDAHDDQMPGDLWEKRRQEWTYEVSAAGWDRTLREIAEDPSCPAVVLVSMAAAEIEGLVMGTGSPSEATAGEINALYVRRDRQRRGLGRRLLAAAAAELAAAGTTRVQIGVLAANESARCFYEAVGGRLVGVRQFDEGGVALSEAVYECAVADLIQPAE